MSTACALITKSIICTYENSNTLQVSIELAQSLTSHGVSQASEQRLRVEDPRNPLVRASGRCIDRQPKPVGPDLNKSIVPPRGNDRSASKQMLAVRLGEFLTAWSDPVGCPASPMYAEE